MSLLRERERRREPLLWPLEVLLLMLLLLEDVEEVAEESRRLICARCELSERQGPRRQVGTPQKNEERLPESSRGPASGLASKKTHTHKEKPTLSVFRTYVRAVDCQNSGLLGEGGFGRVTRNHG